jgi:DNA-binding NtrC family response regulator
MIASPLKGKKILAVDDERDACELITDELMDSEVEAVHTYEDARAKLSQNRYDVAILDIMGVRGFELLTEFAGRTRCIVLTAHALSPADLERAKAGNAALYLSKEELGCLGEYVARVIAAREPLWDWLARRADLTRWFGTT